MKFYFGTPKLSSKKKKRKKEKAGSFLLALWNVKWNRDNISNAVLRSSSQLTVFHSFSRKSKMSLSLQSPPSTTILPSPSSSSFLQVSHLLTFSYPSFCWGLLSIFHTSDSMLQIFPHQKKLGFPAGLFKPSNLISHSPRSLPLICASSGFSSSLDTGSILSLPLFLSFWAQQRTVFTSPRCFFSGLTSELDAVSSFSEIVPDTVVFDDFERYILVHNKPYHLFYCHH